MALFESPFANSMIRTRRLSMAIRTELHAGMVGSLLPHAAIRTRMSGFTPAFDATADARHLPDPGQIGRVSGRSLAGGFTTLTSQFAFVNRPGKVTAELVFTERDWSGNGSESRLAAEANVRLRNRRELLPLDLNRDQQCLDHTGVMAKANLTSSSTKISCRRQGARGVARKALSRGAEPR